MGEKGQSEGDDPRDLPVGEQGAGGSAAKSPCRVCGEPRGAARPCPHCGMD